MYLNILVALDLPVFVTKLPEHFIHNSYRTRYVAICGKMPDNLPKCLTMPITILDGPEQNLFPSITTNKPEETARIYGEMIRQNNYRFYNLKVNYAEM